MKKKVKVNINVGYGETNYDKDDNVLTIFCKSILDVSKELDRVRAGIEQVEMEYNEDACEYLDVKNFYDFSKCEFIIDSIFIFDIEDDTLEILRKYGYNAKKIYLSMINIKEISHIISSIPFSEKTLFYTKYNNMDLSTIDEMYEAFEYINNIRDYILQFDFSPFEQSLFLYDLLRERPYKSSRYDKKHENDDKFDDNIDDKYIIPSKHRGISHSRSLMKIYKEESIVCAGFSNLYMAVLDSLGIRCECTSFNSKDGISSGHSTNIVFMDDDKYDIHFPFEVDVTWGRVYEGNKYLYNESCLNYKWFARDIISSISEKQKKAGLDTGILTDSPIEKFYSRCERFLKLFRMQAPYPILNNDYNMVISGLCELKSKYEISNIDEYIELLKNTRFDDYQDIVKTFRVVLRGIFKKVPIESFYLALKKVKKTESLIGRGNDIDENDIDEILATNYTENECNYLRLVRSIVEDKCDCETFSDYKDNVLYINPVLCLSKRTK